MLRFIVCEDNKESLERICNIINRVMMPYNYEYKTNKFTSYNKEVSELIKTKYEEKIYVLDIELGDVSGLEIASQIRDEDPESVIIFITSHSECKNDIFYSRLLAIDYIQKDRFWEDRFKSTLDYTLKKVNRKRVLAYDFNYNSYRIPFNDILYIEKVQDSPKCIIYTENGSRYEINCTINEMMKKLGPNFFQSHKSCLVNIEKIKRINYVDNTITFVNNQCVYLLSNRRKKAVKEYVANY